MPYIPHTESDVAEMLKTIGVASIDDLFVEIPDNLKLKGDMNVAPGMDEYALGRFFSSLAAKNLNATTLDWFLGAGLYDRYIPSTVGAIISRGEFLTAYTPYQPEMSQGYLQTIYEFQSMIAEIYGMDLANASMYDGSTAMAEAALLSTNLTGRNTVIISDAVHPSYREVLETYCWAIGVEIRLVKNQGGKTPDWGDLSDAACIVVQTPNFFGMIEDLAAVRNACDTSGAKMVVASDPVSCVLTKTPGDFGADIVVGEGQPMGVAMGFGGPLVGLFACKEEYVRKIPGRIVGRTQDANGNWGYVMTLRTREQDIRREKATSNICTNEALMALAATVYMSALGKNGMESIATTSVQNTQYAMKVLQEAGAKIAFQGHVFNEFVIDLGTDAKAVQGKLIEQGIMPGLPLGDAYPELANHMLVAVTEVRKKAEIDNFGAKLKAILA
jgi:glycine dehydrogenase subunit 1